MPSGESNGYPFLASQRGREDEYEASVLEPLNSPALCVNKNGHQQELMHILDLFNSQMWGTQYAYVESKWQATEVLYIKARFKL
ncbi:Uncharacterized protein HZ326_2125 [Fusarium oxysporum f. sp. albedinis]|nr:Uncharacterized protein HZ326_2125 [Fusarium oxysporum f. sp. albedinis]